MTGDMQRLGWRACRNKPCVMSDHAKGNLKGLMKPGQREPSIADCCELVEFATDKSRHEYIPTKDRDTQVMTAQCVAQVKQHRLMNLLLPANWPNDGIYVHVDKRDSGLGVWIRMQHEPNSPMKNVPLDFEGPVNIQDNFSLRDAMIIEENGTKS